MKKILLAGVASFFALSTQAQEINLGLRAGVNYASISGDDAQNTSYRAGLLAGAIVNFGLTDAFSIQPEFNYSAKGYKHETTVGNVTTTERVRLNYLDVPLLAHIKAGGLFFELGPQMSFALSGKQEDEVKKVEANGSENTTTKTKTIDDNPYTIDFGYAAGLGYRMPSGLGVGLRYSGGLKNIFDEGPSTDKNKRHSLFQLSISYVTGY
ncbi:MAG: PorT family protein [Hymenobacteraceae bacterium]|nr:PorT family protein [Hymenobacteraceae bacterium]MDX5396605.1 PorT family protein [Hymenobacteraceae bacterium]MDX5512668.1 PorT family protein [Hymenobacteraceae bacterium]